MSAPSVFLPLRRIGGVLIFSLFSLAATPLAAQQISSTPQPDELTALTKAGMADLSLQLLDQNPPSIDVDPDGWLAWRQQRLAILKQSGQWQQIIDQYNSLSPDEPESNLALQRRYAVDAWLAQGDGESVRNLLLPLIWSDKGSDSQMLAVWRRQVIKSYLVEGRNGDAHAAMLRCEQDYPALADDPAWVATKARVMISDGQPDDAALLAVVSEEPEGQAVYTLARLKGYAALDKALLQAVVSSLSSREIDQPLRQEILTSALAKVATVEELNERISALQQLLLVPDAGLSMTPSVDALWQDYSDYGQAVANRQQLLVGDFAHWFDYADQARSRAPLDAAALYLWLALHSEESGLQARAHADFVAVMRQQPHGAELLRIFYLSSSRYHEVRTLPLAMLYQLIDMAMDEANLTEAGALMRLLDAPEGVELQQWQLLRARYLILAAAPWAETSLLLQQIGVTVLTESQLEYLAKLMFALQNSAREQEAYDLFSGWLPLAEQSVVARQLLYWMGDIRSAQGEMLAAARLYLRAAMLPDSDATDPWVKAARYRAAQALIKAGMVEDGVAIYRDLVSYPLDPERRALLQREILRHTAPH